MWNLGNIHHILSRVPFKFWPLQSKHLPKTAPQWSLDSLWNLFLSSLEKWMWMTALPWFQLASRYEKKLCLMWNVMRFFRSSLCWPTSRQPPTRPRSPLPFRECSSWSSTKSWLPSTLSLPKTRRRPCWRSLNEFFMICFSLQKLAGSCSWVQLRGGRLALRLFLWLPGRHWRLCLQLFQEGQRCHRRLPEGQGAREGKEWKALLNYWTVAPCFNMNIE